MPTGRPKAIFLSGDEDKAFEILKALKGEWHPEGVVSCEWEEKTGNKIKNQLLVTYNLTK